MEIQKALDELKALKIDYNLDLGIDFEKAQLELNQALQLQQTDAVGRSEQLECKCPINSSTIKEEIKKNKCFECGLPIIAL